MYSRKLLPIYTLLSKPLNDMSQSQFIFLISHNFEFSSPILRSHHTPPCVTLYHKCFSCLVLVNFSTKNVYRKIKNTEEYATDKVNSIKATLFLSVTSKNNFSRSQNSIFRQIYVEYFTKPDKKVNTDVNLNMTNLKTMDQPSFI